MSSNMKIQLLDREVGIAQNFAMQSVDSNAGHYQRRQQFNREKIMFDIFVGKASEIGVAKILREQLGVSVSSPDFGVYEARHKNYNADLTFKMGDSVGGIHVKSQHIDSATRFGTSWCFQKTDPLVVSPESTDFIVTCLYKTGAEIEILSVLKATDASGLYAEPIKEVLRKTKTVLYHKDIPDELFKAGLDGLTYYGKRTRGAA